MAESVVLVAQRCAGNGSNVARRLRKQGLVPAVIYGHKEETIPLALAAEEVHNAVRHGARVVDLKADGKQEKALIREVQWDHLGLEILHLDFERVAEHERITVIVPVELRGIAPGATGGGALDQPLHTLHVECEAMSVPDSIRVNINELQQGAAIHVRDLHLPPGLTVLEPPDAIVVQVTVPLAAPEAAVGPAAETAEPEVIGRQKAAEEEAE